MTPDKVMLIMSMVKTLYQSFLKDLLEKEAKKTSSPIDDDILEFIDKLMSVDLTSSK